VDALIDQARGRIRDEQVRGRPIIGIDDDIVHVAEESTVREDDGHPSEFGGDRFSHRRMAGRTRPSTLGCVKASLAAVLVGLERGAQLLRALALVVQAATALARAGLAAVHSAVVSAARDPAQLLVGLD
jgi:hypothetical protein